MKTRLDEVHWSYEYIEGLDKSQAQPFTGSEQIEVMAEIEMDDDNQWHATEDIIVFRLKDTGYLGYYHLVPAGYSSYTYDPDTTCRVYNTNDLDWFYKFALDEELRNKVGYLLEPMLLGKLIDDKLRE